MKLIVCLDDRDGMLFNGRRLSTDRCLRKRILEVTQNGTLWMNSYSARQFTDAKLSVNVDEDFLEKCQTGEYCFLENADVRTCLERIEELTVYRWNRLYPSDTVFPMDAFCGWRKVKSTDFPGNSHEKLTEEVYLP